MPTLTVNSGPGSVAILKLVSAYKFFVLAITAMGILSAWWIAGLMSPVWEAVAVIEPAHVVQAVEPPAQIVTRMLTPSFLHKLYQRDGSIAGDDPPESSFLKSVLKVRPLPNSEWLEIKLRAPSQDAAKKRALAVVDQLRQEHDELLKPRVEQMKRQLALVDGAIQDAKGEMSKLQQRLASGGKGASDMVLYNMLIQQKTAQMHDLAKDRLNLINQMDPAWVFPTRLLGEVYVSQSPVSPKKGTIVIFGGVFAFVLGLLGAYAHSSVMNRSRG